MADDKNPKPCTHLEEDEAVFDLRMVRVEVLDGVLVEEDGLSFFEGNAMLREVSTAFGRVPLEAKLIRLAAETGRSVDEVALDLLASSVDHDEWFRNEVEKGRASAREGRLLDHDDVAARMDRRYRG